MFLDQKNPHCENDYTTQSNLQSQYNPYQITNGIFYRTRTKNLKICMETQKTPNSQSNLFFFLTSLLEYNCFALLCQFLLYIKVNQLYVYIYPHIPSLSRLPPTFPIPPLQVVTKHQAGLPVLCQPSNLEGKKTELEESDSLTSDCTTKLQ